MSSTKITLNNHIYILVNRVHALWFNLFEKNWLCYYIY